MLPAQSHQLGSSKHVGENVDESTPSECARTINGRRDAPTKRRSKDRVGDFSPFGSGLGRVRFGEALGDFVLGVVTGFVSGLAGVTERAAGDLLRLGIPTWLRLGVGAMVSPSVRSFAKRPTELSGGRVPTTNTRHRRVRGQRCRLAPLHTSSAKRK